MISVIIPTYNRQNYIAGAIESVLAQTCTDYEIIVIDDGSTDNTRHILEPYLGKIKYIRQENAGVSTARNTGIKNASGQYIAFLDSDDRWQKQKLEVQIEFMKKNNLDVCFTDFKVEYEDQKHCTDFQQSFTEKNFRVYENGFKLYFERKFGLLVQSMIVAKQVLAELDCFDEKMTVAEDTKLIYELAYNGRFGFVDAPLTILTRHQSRNGLINEKPETEKALLENHIQIIQNAIDRKPPIKGDTVKKLKKMLGHLYSIRARNSAMADDYDKAKQDSIRAIKVGGNFKTYRRALFTLCLPGLAGKVFKKNIK